MPIYHCSVKSVSRKNGRSSPAAAAYRAGERIVNDRTGRIHDYRYKARGVTHKEIVFPEGTRPVGRAGLWNIAEAAEKRHDAKTAREYELALPHELNHQQRVEVAREFARAIVARYGVVADVCLHLPNKKGNQKNHHAHILTTTRKYTAKGLGEKTRVLDSPRTSKAEVEGIRAIWEDVCNAALARTGSLERIDRRTLKAQGVEREPTIHIGPAATEMERRGVKTDLGDHNRHALGDEEREVERARTYLQKMRSGISGTRKKYAERKAAEAAARAKSEWERREREEKHQKWLAERKEVETQKREEEERARREEEAKPLRRGMSR